MWATLSLSKLDLKLALWPSGLPPAGHPASARILSSNAEWLIRSTFLGHLRELLRLLGT